MRVIQSAVIDSAIVTESEKTREVWNESCNDHDLYPF